MKKISGKVVYKNIGPGCWGIIDANGKEWRPLHLPMQLRKEGKQVSIMAREVEEGMSIFMWGTAVEVLGFDT